jgi:hypothetical protein
MEFFLKNKIVIARSLGALMLVVGFAIHFWVTPKKGLSENSRAAANVARMEAKVKGTSNTAKKVKPDHSKFMDKLKNTQEKQIEYLTIFSMLIGALFLGYSFIKREEK